MKVAVGMASGIGNGVYLLPAIKALKDAGCNVSIYVEDDYRTEALWRRCVYADGVMVPPASTNGHQLACGPYRPKSWRNCRDVNQFTLRRIHDCEWRSNLRIAEAFGWSGAVPDVSDWCRDLDRSKRFDVGIVPGCKTGLWLRKRWPGMTRVAQHFIDSGLRVAVFGQFDDDVSEVPGWYMATEIDRLPDALASCRVIVGTDSGPTHLASSLGVPVVMVYTATSEVKAEPMGPHETVFGQASCRPCVSTPKWSACKKWICQDIDPGDVIGAVKRICGLRLTS